MQREPLGHRGSQRAHGQDPLPHALHTNVSARNRVGRTGRGSRVAGAGGCAQARADHARQNKPVRGALARHKQRPSILSKITVGLAAASTPHAAAAAPVRQGPSAYGKMVLVHSLVAVDIQMLLGARRDVDILKVLPAQRHFVSIGGPPTDGRQFRELAREEPKIRAVIQRRRLETLSGFLELKEGHVIPLVHLVQRMHHHTRQARPCHPCCALCPRFHAPMLATLVPPKNSSMRVDNPSQIFVCHTSGRRQNPVRVDQRASTVLGPGCVAFERVVRLRIARVHVGLLWHRLAGTKSQEAAAEAKSFVPVRGRPLHAI